MPRKQSSEVRLYCLKCKDYTQSKEPIIIKKDIGSRFHIKAMCSICNKFKTKFLSLEQVKLLPDEIKNSVDGSTFTNTIERNGGIIPIIPLIMAVAAGVSALASAGSATASAIISAKNSAEDEKHHRELESIARGTSISNDVIKNDNNLQIGLLANNPPNVNGNAINPLLVSSIIAIIPELIKAVPEAANQIKQLIDGEGIKIDEPKVLSDDKLIDQYSNFLRGHGYDISM